MNNNFNTDKTKYDYFVGQTKEERDEKKVETAADYLNIKNPDFSDKLKAGLHHVTDLLTKGFSQFKHDMKERFKDPAPTHTPSTKLSDNKYSGPNR